MQCGSAKAQVMPARGHRLVSLTLEGLAQVLLTPVPMHPRP